MMSIWRVIAHLVKFLQKFNPISNIYDLQSIWKSRVYEFYRRLLEPNKHVIGKTKLNVTLDFVFA